MKRRRAIFKRNIGVLLICCSFVPHGLGKGEEREVTYRRSASVEKRLGQYLEHRVLVFRKEGIGGVRVEFDSREQLLRKSRRDDNLKHGAILFVNLEIGPERLLIFGEAVRVWMKGGKRTYLRDSGKLNLVTCTVKLDVSVEDLTFAKAITTLSRIFLMKEELAKVYPSEPPPEPDEEWILYGQSPFSQLELIDYSRYEQLLRK